MSDISLRDEIALAILPALLQSLPPSLDQLGDPGFWKGNRREAYAKLAYQMADAMLKERIR